jgi:hypothetical protein
MSPNTQRVMVALEEKGLKYELKQIRVMESEHKVRQVPKDYSLVDFEFFSHENIWMDCNHSVSFLYLSMKMALKFMVSK